MAALIRLWYLDWESHPDRALSVRLADSPPPDKREYRLVYEGEYPIDFTDLEAICFCDSLFEEFNIGDRGGQQNIRSMSVGDIVEIGDKLIMCKSIGWSEVQWKR